MNASKISKIRDEIVSKNRRSTANDSQILTRECCLFASALSLLDGVVLIVRRSDGVVMLWIGALCWAMLTRWISFVVGERRIVFDTTANGVLRLINGTDSVGLMMMHRTGAKVRALGDDRAPMLTILPDESVVFDSFTDGVNCLSLVC